MDKKVLHSIIGQRAKVEGNSIAIETLGKRATYYELENSSNQIAQCLLEHRIKEGTVVGIYLESGIEYVSSLIGINKSGGIFMPLELSYPIKRVEYLLEKVEPPLIITEEKNVGQLLQILIDLPDKIKVPQVIILKEGGYIEQAEVLGGQMLYSGNKLYSTEGVGQLVNGDSSNYLLYTSGSTGAPKIIEGCHKGLSHFIHWEKEEFNLGHEVRVSQLAPTTFDVSLRDIFVPLLSGGTLCIPDKEIKGDPSKLLKWIGHSKINLMHLVPSMFRLLIKEIKDDPGALNEIKNLKHILLAGEPIYGRDIKAWREVAGKEIEIVNLYGPTETTLAKIYHRIKDLPEDLNEIIPLGRPISGSTVLITNNNSLTKIGAIGEICIKTPFRTKGYYRDPDLTKEKFVQNPLHNDYEDIIYKTGDLGKYLNDGVIAFVGRQDSQVKIRGNRIELAEVENILLGIDAIDHVVVLSIRKAEGEDVLACYYTENHSLEKGQIRKHLNNYLPEYMHPSYYIRLGAFPLNINGKIDKRALPAPEELLYEQLTYEPASNDIEQELSQIWSEILGLQKVGVTNSFFELGGHSLSATKVVSRIYKKLGREVNLKEFFDHPTIRSLAKLIRTKDRGEYVEIKPAAYQPYYDLSYAQKLIWILQQSEDQMTAYNMLGSYIFNTELNKTAFKRAFKTLVERHESLRSNIIVVEGEPKQKIWQEVDFELEEINELADYNDDAIEKYIKEEYNKPFDLSAGQLFRGKLIKLKKEKYLFILSMHHIISDGWSRGVLASEILRLYNAYGAGEENPLEPLRIQYKDYVSWINLRLSDEGLKKERAYWYHKLSGEIPTIDLPYDFGRGIERTYKGDKLAFTISKKDSQTIRQLCNYNDCSLYMFLVAVIKLMLYNYSGQKDIIVGSPVSGRGHIDLENLIGIFLNNLIIRSEINSKESFREFLKRVKHIILEAYEHQNFPYEKLVEEIGVDSKSNRNPFYDVLIVMDNSELNGSKKDINDFSSLLNIEEVNIEDSTSKLDLTFFIDDSEEIRINIEYKTELFKLETIEEIKENFLRLLKTVIEDIDIIISVSIQSLFSDSERQTFDKISLNNVSAIQEEF